MSPLVTVVPSDIYPAVRRFLVESGLQRTLKAFDKETSGADDAGVVKPKLKKATAKALAELELTEASQLWLDTRTAGVAVLSDGAVHDPEGESVPKRKKKEPEAEQAEQAEAENAAAEVDPEVHESKKRKRRKDVEEEPEEVTVETDKPRKKKQSEQVSQDSTQLAEAEAEAPPPQKKKKNKEKQEKKPGTPFKRIDEDAWTSSIKDSRLLDNTHQAKIKFGGGDGDTWADKASEDLLKVKGKGFRKEMAKKKRASWRGGGSLDMGVNSVKFDDNSDEE